MRIARTWTLLAILAAVTVTGSAQRGTFGEIVSMDGDPLKPFAPDGAASVIFFVASDCPISNGYAPEIQRVCRNYAARGVSCVLIYEDVDPSPLEIRRHRREYAHGDIPAAIDRERAIARQAKATITPQAVVVDRQGQVRYRGRIDNFYAALGKPRQQVTEHDLRNALEDLLAGRPVATPETPALGCHIVDPGFLRK
jgi:redoxin